jgi:uncharacterized protein (TIGR02452 family)
MAQPITRTTIPMSGLFYQHTSHVFTELAQIRSEIKQQKNAEGWAESSDKVLALFARLQNLKAVVELADSAANVLPPTEQFGAARTLSVLAVELRGTEAKLKKVGIRSTAPATKSIPAPLPASTTVLATKSVPAPTVEPAVKAVPAPVVNPLVNPLGNREIVSFSVCPCSQEIPFLDPTIDMMLVNIIHLFKSNQFDEAMIVFSSLPNQIQSDIFGKHWEVCGKPTKESKEESLRKMAHDQFGKVSFLDTVKECKVPNAKRAEAVEKCLPLLEGKILAAKEATHKTALKWNQINQSPIPGLEKNEKKKASLDALIKNELFPLFYGKKLVCETPDCDVNPNTGLPGNSIQAYLAAYAKKYPCFTPFCLQLFPSLKLENSLHFKSSQAKNPADQIAQKGSQQYLTEIMSETIQTLKKGSYINAKGEKITLNVQPAISSLASSSAIITTNQPINNGFATKLFLDKKDCLKVAQDCAARGLNPIVLDAASDYDFGGGYLSGARAQEEDLARRTTLCIAVDPKQGKQTKRFYPLSKQGDAFGLYVNHITVFRGERDEGYAHLEMPFEVAMAIMAAPNFGQGHQERLPPNQRFALENNRLPPKQAKEMEAKLRNVLLMAQARGHKSVVLMPFGCGAFANPPQHVAQIMLKLTLEFAGTFEEIHIAAIDDHNTKKAHNPQGNHFEFQQTMQDPQFARVMNQKGGSIHYT